MRRSHALIRLSWLVAVLALIGAGAGLLWRDGGSPFAFTTLHGQTVRIAGQGLYRYDTLFKAPIQRGTDAVTILVCVPLLAFAIRSYGRGSLRGGLLLAGTLAFLLYNAASLAFGVAYNSMILIYIAWFSASLFALVLACHAIDLAALPARVSARLPHRGIAVFVLVSGMTLFVWLADIVGGLRQGQVPPGIASYTTEITYVIDLGIIMPTAFLASFALRRRSGAGYLLAAIVLIMNALIGVTVIGQTIVQTLEGITLSTGEYVGKVGSFVVMGAIAAALIVTLLCNVAEPEAPERVALARASV